MKSNKEPVICNLTTALNALEETVNKHDTFEILGYGIKYKLGVSSDIQQCCDN